ncbi:MAG: trypsin-like peptidase domain-containing protein [Eubacteriales bacterium]|nr:trypsin-like peptidase domain-containing protein [Eubacteriales bacterium]MDD4324218.1 trypsin-like peptidase domain-containing protein [Eubacteriales bacterium]
MDYDLQKEEERGPRKKRSVWSRLLALVLAAVIFGGVAAFVFDAVYSQIKEPEPTAAARVEQQVPTATERPPLNVDYSRTSGYSVSDIAQIGLPSTVAITNISVQEVNSYFGLFGFFGPPQLQKTTSFGSGIIVEQTEDKYYIVTNYHVVEGSRELSVSFTDEYTVAAELEVTSEKDDLAIVSVLVSEIPEETLAAISVARLCQAGDVIVGEGVVAIGNALGYGMSVSSGVVSAVDRQIRTSNDPQDEEANSYIQTDAAINPGNSGGALFNMRGEVIGVNTVKVASTEVEGMGYAIPIERIEILMEVCRA